MHYLLLVVLHSTWSFSGNCILHDVASSNHQSNAAVLRFLLGYPCCHDLLLCTAAGLGKRNLLPLDLAKENKVSVTYKQHTKLYHARMHTQTHICTPHPCHTHTHMHAYKAKIQLFLTIEPVLICCAQPRDPTLDKGNLILGQD